LRTMSATNPYTRELLRASALIGDVDDCPRGSQVNGARVKGDDKSALKVEWRN